MNECLDASELTPHSQSLKLVDQVALDLNAYLGRFPNKSFAIRVLSQESGLHQKTIKRLLNKENRPTYQTLFQLYSIFFSIDNYEKLLEKCPQIVRREIESYNPNPNSLKPSQSESFYELIRRDPVLAEIYVLIGTGTAKRATISELYGKYGLELLEQLCESRLIRRIDKDTFGVTPNSPSFGAQTIKYLGELFTRRFCKPNEAQVTDKNVMSFYAEGLNEAGREMWCKLDADAFYQKLQIAKDPKYKGSIPMFTFAATDTIHDATGDCND